MSLEPLTTAPAITQYHAFAAMGALVLGTGQLLLAKGTARHRLAGNVWLAAMVFVAVSSLFIHGIRMFGAFSLIHVLSIFTLAMLPLAVFHARRGNFAAHGRLMTSLYWLALVGAGVFTLLPNRIMGKVIFGQ